jgi:hypothetical protein
MGHDRLFKTLLREFLAEFLELFFPDEAARLDFGTLRFLDKELFEKIAEGSRREADLVAEVQDLGGAAEIVLIHVEVQVRPERDFARRMFEYYALLSMHHQKPIFPVVLYLRGGQGLMEEQYRVRVFGRERLRFRYESVGLAGLAAGEYVERGPLGAALGSLMDRRRSGDVVELRASMMRRIVESELREELQRLLANVVGTYFVLGPEDRERYRRVLARKEYRKVQEVELTWADKLKEEGREEGLRAGKRGALLQLLTAKFGSLPRGVVSRVETLESVEALDRYLTRVLTAGSLEEMGLGEPAK